MAHIENISSIYLCYNFEEDRTLTVTSTVEKVKIP